MLKRATKKQFYAAGQQLIAHPAAGLAGEAFIELSRLISHPVYSQGKFSPQVTLADGLVEINSIDLRQIPEIVWQTALCRDIELVLFKGHVGSFGEFLRAIKKLDWLQFFHAGATVSVRCEALHSRLYHETKLSNALEDQLKSLGFKAASKKESDYSIRLYQYKNTLQVALSLAGKPLFKRGYRHHLSSNAPLAEHIAASLIHFHLNGLSDRIGQVDTSIDRLSGIYVPFAGSGTFGFEGISQLLGLLPSLGQRRFAFETMPLFPDKTLSFVKKKLLQRQGNLSILNPSGLLGLSLSQGLSISFLEKDQQTFNGLCADVAQFERIFSGLQEHDNFELHIKKQLGDFFATSSALGLNQTESGHVLALINPPYGIRLKHRFQSSASFYHRIASRLTQLLETCTSMSGLILLASDEAFYGFSAGIKAYKGGSLGRSLSFNQGGRHIRAVEFFLS